jgi:hypothetical protein
MEKFSKNFPFLFFLFFYQLASTQSSKLGIIEIYGNRKIPSAKVFTILDIKEGDNFSQKTFKSDDLLTKLIKIPGVKHAMVNSVCCDTDNNLILYIGLSETDSGVLKYRASPMQNLLLSQELMVAHKTLKYEIRRAVRIGKNTEYDSLGYTLLHYEPARKEQYKFISFAKNDLNRLQDVLKHSKSSEHRAAAAMIIAYSGDKKKVTENLMYAVNDPDEEVRNNAIRALGILIPYIQTNPALKISIPADPFIKLVNSVIWTDRNKGASVLMQLTQTREPNLLEKIRQQAMPSIIEMARWKNRNHAMFSFVILGRIAGISDDALFKNNFSTGWKKDWEAMVREINR